jgi:hypothetical protein
VKAEQALIGVSRCIGTPSWLGDGRQPAKTRTVGHETEKCAALEVLPGDSR